MLRNHSPTRLSSQDLPGRLASAEETKVELRFCYRIVSVTGKITYRTVSGPSYASENSDSVGLAKGPFCEFAMTGVRWLVILEVYCPADEVWLLAVPKDGVYAVLLASIAILSTFAIAIAAA